MSAESIVFAGYLEKLGGWIKNWKRRYFVLQRSQLNYFTDETEAAQGPAFARGSLMVCGSSLRALEPAAASGKQFAIGLTQACSTRLYVFVAPSEQARIDWLTAFVKAGGGSSRGSVSLGSPAGGLLGGSSQASSPLPERMFAASSHEGFLQKLGGMQKTTWQPRYFVLLSEQLLYFREPNFSETDTDNDAPRGSISLRGATLHVEPRSVDVYGVPYAFSITPAEPQQRSLMSSLFAKDSRAYVMVAKDYVDLSTWVTRLREKMAKAIETEENSESDEDEQRTPATQSAAATAASAIAFVPPAGDVLSSLYKLDSSTIDGGGGLDTGGWKKRYAVLELKDKTLRLWKRKPSADEPASKPKTVDLKFASLTVNSTLKCSKAKNIPVLTISFPPAKDDAASSYSSPFLHLAPSTQSRFDSWLSFLTLACGKKRRTQSAAATQQDAENPSANASSDQTPAPAAAAKSSSRKASTAGSESAAPASSAAKQPRDKRCSGTGPISESAPAEKRSQSQLLAAMSASLADDDAMASFRSGCADLARGTLPPAKFFRGFWRTFGKRLGRAFWAELVSIIPHEETQTELTQLYEQHREVLEAKSTEEEAEDDSAASSPDPSPSPLAPSMPSFHPRPNGHTVAAGAGSDADSAMPSFVPPLPHDWTPVSPVSSNSSDFSSPSNAQQQQPAAASSPTAAQQRKDKASAAASSAPPPAAPPAAAVSDSSSDDPVSRAHLLVSAWSLRCDHHILTLLCTLHEVLPSVVAVGQFIPFDETYPGLKQVHSCYLKAVRVLHPDKTKHLSQSVQVLGQAVFQTVQAAWEKYEKAEKKKAAKEAKQQAAAAANAGEQPD